MEKQKICVAADEGAASTFSATHTPVFSRSNQFQVDTLSLHVFPSCYSAFKDVIRHFRFQVRL